MKKDLEAGKWRLGLSAAAALTFGITYAAVAGADMPGVEMNVATDVPAAAAQPVASRALTAGLQNTPGQATRKIVVVPRPSTRTRAS
jgi:hypothetical protein